MTGSLNRLLENFYSALFERAPSRQNAPQTEAFLYQESMPAPTDDGVTSVRPMTARYYGPLTLTGSDQDADASIYRPQATTGRVQYGAGVCDETTMTLVFRIKANSSSTTMASGYFFNWSDGASDYLRCWFDTGTNVWTIQRSATGGAAAQSHTVAASFAANDNITVAFKFTSSTIGISINGGAFSMGGGSADIPALAATLIDLLSNAGASQLDAGVHWMFITLTALSDAQIAAIHATGNTDPDWDGTYLNGANWIDVSFLWHCSDTVPTLDGAPLSGVQYHEPMSSTYGEDVYG